MVITIQWQKKAHIRSIIHKATINPTDGYANFDPIEVYDITMDDNCRLAQSRVGIQQYIRSVNFPSSHAFLVFHYETVVGRSWRFSYFYKKETVASVTDSKRYTYLFGKGTSSRTANERFNELLKITSANWELGSHKANDKIHIFTNEDITSAFSVEALSDEFFYKYLGYYASFVKYLTGKPTAKESGEHAIKEAAFRRVVSDMDKLGVKDNRDQFKHSFLPRFKSEEECEKAICDYVKKMMGRVVFLHFLQKKGWMCGDRDFMYHLFDNSSLKDDFLDRVLEPLFFVILNTHPDDRLEVCRRHNDKIQWEPGKLVEWDESLVESWHDIPYLNGGLFEQEKIDECRSIFPAEYFEKFLDFFRQYNFTIDENDPNDVEVGVDPEMLSKIFENLLEDNKEKGAFYTPKEIVSYMCSESLIAYLGQYCKDGEWNEEFIRKFVTDPSVNEHLTQRQREEMINALVQVQVCDPAIGSGAFPMGMLNLIARCRGELEDTSMSDIKRHIIQNNIFGVDIEQGAVDIARLRFWLSLVVDETEPHALPNLDYRIMRGNSLFTTFYGEYLDLSKTNDARTRLSKMKRQLFDMQSDYYNLSGEAKWKQEIEIKHLLLNIVEEQLGMETGKVASESLHQYDIYNGTSGKIKKNVAKANETYKRKAECVRKITTLRNLLGGNGTLHERARTDIDFFDWEIMFSNVFTGGREGFDIVIGNPPYVDIKELPSSDVKLYFNLFKTASNRINLYSIFIEKGYYLCCKGGVLSYINPNSMLVNESYLETRKLIVDDIELVIKLPDNVFHSAKVETIIFQLLKGNVNKYIRTFCFGNADELDLVSISLETRDRLLWKKENNIRFNIFSNQATLLLLSKIESRANELGAYVQISLGITPYDKYKGHDSTMIKNRVFHSNIPIDDFYVPLISGKNISPYYVNNEIAEYLKYGDWLAAPREKKFFINEKIIIRQIVGDKLRIIAAYSDVPHFFTQIGFSLITKDNDSDTLKVILAILNSHLMSYYHKEKFLDTQKVLFQKVLIVNAKKLPIILPANKENIVGAVNRILTAKCINSSADISAEEREIDRLVYHLYNLTYDEVKIVDPETPITEEEYYGQ